MVAVHANTYSASSRYLLVPGERQLHILPLFLPMTYEEGLGYVHQGEGIQLCPPVLEGVGWPYTVTVLCWGGGVHCDRPVLSAPPPPLFP